jgi:DHA1 family inner membrane transport protein
MFGGLTVANVLGVPFGALVGEHWGWRAAFWAITVIGLVALAGIALLVPGPADRGRPAAGTGGSEPVPPVSLRAQLGAFRSGQVWLTLTATALSYGGMFGAFSYIAYTFTEVGGFPAADVAWLLMVYGTGLVVGNVVGGRAADHDRDRALVLALLGLTVTLAAFGLLAGSATASVVLVFLMGLFGFASVPGMITRVTDFAQGAPLAASANVSASNLGNALGAWLGGLAITAGLGYSSPLYVGSAIVLAALVVMVVAAGHARSTLREPAPDSCA